MDAEGLKDPVRLYKGWCQVEGDEVPEVWRWPMAGTREASTNDRQLIVDFRSSSTQTPEFRRREEARDMSVCICPARCVLRSSNQSVRPSWSSPRSANSGGKGGSSLWQREVRLVDKITWGCPPLIIICSQMGPGRSIQVQLRASQVDLFLWASWARWHIWHAYFPQLGEEYFVQLKRSREPFVLIQGVQLSPLCLACRNPDHTLQRLQIGDGLYPLACKWWTTLNSLQGPVCAPR